MGFPVFDMPFVGNPLLVALDAVFHVFVSHGVAIGVGTMIVVAEWIAVRRGAPEWDAFARRLARVAVVVIVAVGAPTGVGIWLITSVVAPRGIGSLLRVFFWPWFVEWLVFTSEVVLLLAYRYTWERWSGALKRRHLRLGFAYVGVSVLTAVLITGILGFMLTSDGWPWDERLARGFLNPSYPAMLVLRLGVSFLLGALFTGAWLLSTRQDPAFRATALRVFGRVAAAAAAVALAGAAAWAAAIPQAARPFWLSSWGARVFGGRPSLFWGVNAALLALVLAFAARAAAGRARGLRPLAGAAIVAALGLVGEFEFLREALRKPWLMPGYMYVNQILVAEAPVLRQEGLLRSSWWYAAAVPERSARKEGAYLFLQSCSRCHGIRAGFNAIVDRVRGRPPDAIAAILAHADEMVPFMPPFAGTAEERRILAEYLDGVATGRIPAGEAARFSIREGGR